MNRLNDVEIAAKALLLSAAVKPAGGEVEIVGKWIWVRFASRPSREIRDTIRAEGGRWSSRRSAWALNNGWQTGKSRCSMHVIRAKYGAAVVEPDGVSRASNPADDFAAAVFGGAR